MTEHDEGGVGRLVRASVGPVADAGPRRDLWPDVLGRIQERPRVSRADWALLGIVLVCAPLFPRAFLFLVCSI